MVQDFFMAALPWIVMGLSAGIILGAVAAAAKAKNEGKTVNTTPTYFMVGVLWSIVALLELIGSKPSTSKGTTYLILPKCSTSPHRLISAGTSNGTWASLLPSIEADLGLALYESFLSSGSKYLQNSSRKQKITIIFALLHR